MNPDTPTSDLHAVQHEVVGESACVQGIALEQRHVLRARCGERVMTGDQPSLLVAVLEQGELVHPQESVAAFVDQLLRPGDGQSQSAQDRAGGLPGIRHQEEEVVVSCAGRIEDRPASLLGQVLEDRGLYSSARTPDPDQTLRAQGLGRLHGVVDPLPRPGSAPRDRKRLHDAALPHAVREDPEGTVRDSRGHILELEGEPDVRLVAPEALQRFAVRQPWIGAPDGPAGGAEHFLHKPLHERVQRLRIRKRHLDVDLRELRLAVGAQILVAETLGDLEIAVVARDHEELLVDLRRLRQRVEASRVDPRGNQVLARSFRRAARQDGCLDLQKAVRVEELSRCQEDPVPHFQDPLLARTSQVQIAVAQTHLLGDVRLVGEGEGQGLGSVQDLETGRPDFNLPRRQHRIQVPGTAGHHLPAHRNHVLGADRLGGREGFRGGFRVEHRLCDSEAIAQVAEQEPAVIAHTVDPAEKTHVAPRVAPPERAAGVGPLREPPRLSHPSSPGAAPPHPLPRSSPASRRT